MEIDFDGADRQLSDFVTIPEGTYKCQIGEIRMGFTRTNAERWSLRLVVAEGQHVGRLAAWDSLIFTQRGLARARLLFKAVGLPHTGKVAVLPEDLQGRTVMVTVRPAEYQSPDGVTVRRNEVPYDGYAEVPK